MAKGRLRIAVIGGEVGESVVITTPGGEVGVVDCFQGLDDIGNPTLRDAAVAKCDRLRFLAATHPHADHIMGLRAVLDAKSPREVWIPQPLGPRYLTLITRLALDETRGMPRDVAERQRSVIEEWTAFVERVLQDRSNGKLAIQALVAGLPLYEEEEHEFSIHCLSPSFGATIDYSKILHPERKEPSPYSPHNRISSVLLVRYGSWLGVLGADAEIRTWQDIVETKSDAVAGANWIKVAHHGSPTGIFGPLYTRSSAKGCVAFVTGFALNRLPRVEGLMPLWDSGIQVYCTNANALERRDPHLAKHHEDMPVTGRIVCNVNSDGESEVTFEPPAGLLSRPVETTR